VLAWTVDLGAPLVLFFLLRAGWLARLARLPFGAEGATAIIAGGLLERGLVVMLLGWLAQRPLRAAGLFLVALFGFFPDVLGRPADIVHRSRSFFGVYSVVAQETEVGRFHTLMNGGVQHGAQNLARPLGPISYYVREGPVGQFFTVAKDLPKPIEHIGVVGLGVGMMACYAQGGQRLTYYEIDPLDERIARDPALFTYLASARAALEVKIGDGRRLLEREPDGSLDVLVLSAFSGDAIPVHLLTREAFELYRRKLSERGLILMIVSNVHLNLVPVVANVVAEVGLHAVRSPRNPRITTPGGEVGDFIAVARRPEDAARLTHLAPAWEALGRFPEASLWTDDFSNVLQVLRWGLGYDPSAR
jgi:hypothetical protein